MADTKISDLTEATILEAADELVVVQGGTTKRVGFDTLVKQLSSVAYGRPDDFDAQAAVDCDFDGSLGPFTAVQGASGTISLLETSTSVAKYDLTSLPSTLLMQAGHGVSLSFRADYQLADGESITMAVLLPGIPRAAGDNSRLILTLNDADTDPDDGNGCYIGIEQDTTSLDMQSFAFGTASGGSTSPGADIDYAPFVLLRWIRSGLTYVPFFSFGGGWYPLTEIDAVGAFTNIWIAMNGPSSGQTYMPVGGVLWTKVGGVGFEPW